MAFWSQVDVNGDRARVRFTRNRVGGVRLWIDFDEDRRASVAMDVPDARSLMVALADALEWFDGSEPEDVTARDFEVRP